MATKTKKRKPASYLEQMVSFGGEAMTRAEMIRQLQTIAAQSTADPVRQRMLIDRCLQGHEIFERNQH